MDGAEGEPEEGFLSLQLARALFALAETRRWPGQARP